MGLRLRIGEHTPSRCISWTHEVHTDLTRTPGRSDPRTPGRSRHEPFVITRTLDALSPVLAQAAASGEMIPEIILEVHRTGDAGLDEPWFSFRLERAYVVHWVTSLEDGTPLETATFDYGLIAWRFLGPHDPSLPAPGAHWDVHPRDISPADPA